MDSGAFTELSLYGHYRNDVFEYGQQIFRWRICGNLELAVAQDYMCEPFILAKTGLTIQEHQKLTIERYANLAKDTELSGVTIMPVIQGYAPEEYLRHVDMYGDLLKNGARVGVGSICKRNSNPRQIVNVLDGIKRERPDLRLHGFGLKLTALKNNYIQSLLYSADSMAWSYSARRQGGNPNGLQEAQDFCERIIKTGGRNSHQFELAGLRS
jgi:hypothetical protein